MKVKKVGRYRKIVGDFGENLVLYWLTKYGVECATLDHIGIDLIARNRYTNELMGISVKGRCRNTGKEGVCITIPKNHFKKVKIACKTFNCIPYFAIIADEFNEIMMFILPMKHLLKLFPVKKRALYWKMGKKYIKSYLNNPNIRVVRFKHETLRWWKTLNKKITFSGSHNPWLHDIIAIVL
jgi:hypothetical protein